MAIRLTEKGKEVTEDYATVRDELLIALISDVNGLTPGVDRRGGCA